MGRGIVEPVDDFRESNPASIPKLLDALAADFAAHGFDQKHIIRTILASRTYQLGSQATELNRTDDKYFSHARSRLLTAEQLLDAVCSVTGVAEKYPGLPPGTRATQLPGPDSSTDFLKVFGQPGRESVCDCERSTTPKLTQALQLINGPLVSRKLADRHGRLAQQLGGGLDRVQLAGEPPSAGRVLWLAADRGVLSAQQTAAEDGQPVAAWRDQSGAGRDCQQSEAARQPVFVADAIGGLPALRFDGDDSLLSSTVDLLASGAPRTVLMVAKANPTAIGGAIFTFRRSTAGGKTVFTAEHCVVAGQNYVYSDGFNGSGNASIPLTAEQTVRKPFISAFVSAGAGQKLAVHLNGEPLAVTQPGGVGTDDGATGFSVGNREDVTGYGWNGELCEVLVYDSALSAEQLAAAGSYLATKYDLDTKYPLRQPAPAAAANGKSDRQIVTEWYLAALARRPSEEELAAVERHIALVGDRHAGLEDFCWALLNSKEFVFQH